ncbi:hypothetical protein BJ138DRAFT_1130318 [Hygrophoropsis aurantiaca]|uniref:Uncharacterized protein n=1 Tax=Hygrophoropsis aurantiaca TaxID=72124 RepID=A0ACB7ZXS1_9AGAM|nr:hypothetical protein BJ138DRAFT_1130318 [Hygrophoropsis aurantiaca]
MTAIATSLVTAQVSKRLANDTVLRPFLVYVRLPANLPHSQSTVPLSISVSVTEQPLSYFCPSVQTAFPDEDSSLSTKQTDIFFEEWSDVYDGAQDSPAEFENIPIPFLPLPKRFDFSKTSDWAPLAAKIHGWLLTSVPTISQQWTWGCDAFWLAFTAAYPNFPRGQWPKIDPRIPLEGQIAQQWLEQVFESDATNQLEDNRTEFLGGRWNEFCCHASLFFPHRIVQE